MRVFAKTPDYAGEMTRGDGNVDAEEGAGRLRKSYKDQLDRRGSLAEASRRLGKPEGFLADQKDNVRGMRSLDVLRSLEVLGNPLPEEVYHEALFSEEKDPARILAYSREFQDLKPDPFVVGCLPRLAVLATAGPTPEGEWISRDSAIRDLDRLRRRNRASALKKLHKLICAALDQLEVGDRHRAAFSDLCSALGVLAAIYRLAGRRDDALDLLVGAYPLAMHSKDRKIEAGWYQKAAYVLVDLKRFLRAKEFINRAHLLYDLAGAMNERLRTLVDLAYVLAEEKKPEQCLEHLKAICPQLPASDIEFRFAAHQLMSSSYQELGMSDDARSELEKARSLMGDDLLAKTCLLSVRAEILCGNGEFQAGAATFRDTIPLIAQTMEVAELVPYALDYASLLYRTGDLLELRLLLAELRNWMGRLKVNLKLKTAVENFQAMVELERLDPRSFTLITNEILAAVPRGKTFRRALARTVEVTAKSFR